MTDHDLSRLLHAAADEAPLPHHDLVARSARRGAVRRRVRLGAGLAAAVTLVAAGSGTVLALSAGPDDDTTQVAADPAPTTTQGTTQGTAQGTAQPTTPTPAPGGPSPRNQPSVPEWTPPPRGDRSDLAVFADVVGEVSQGVGVLSDAASYPYGYRGIRSVSAVLTDDVGPARVQVAITTQDPTVDAMMRVPIEGDCAELALDSLTEALECLSDPTSDANSCANQAIRGWECRDLAGGGTLRWGIERTYTDERDQGEFSNSAILFRDDGLLVNVYAFNGAGEKLGASRETPPLDLVAVKRIALDARWADVDLAG